MKDDGTKDINKIDNKEAKWLNKMNKQVYLESEMKLDERLNRNAHYRARDAIRDE